MRRNNLIGWFTSCLTSYGALRGFVIGHTTMLSTPINEPLGFHIIIGVSVRTRELELRFVQVGSTESLQLGAGRGREMSRKRLFCKSEPFHGTPSEKKKIESRKDGQ